MTEQEAHEDRLNRLMAELDSLGVALATRTITNEEFKTQSTKAFNKSRLELGLPEIKG